MWATKAVILILVMLTCSISSDTVLHSNDEEYEGFLKEVNELRSKFAIKNKIPNMYKLYWSETLKNGSRKETLAKQWLSKLYYLPNCSDPTAGDLESLKRVGSDPLRYKEGVPKGESEILSYVNPLQMFLSCESLSHLSMKSESCSLGSAEFLNFWYSNPGEAGSRCPPRFKGENGLCVPKDPSKHTFWGTEDQLLEDVNYMKRKYAKEFGIPNMHRLTWNDSLVETLDEINVETRELKFFQYQTEYILSNDSSSNGFGKSWRITELPSFSGAVVSIEEVVNLYGMRGKTNKRRIIKGKEEYVSPIELVYPLQTSVGCMKKQQKIYDIKPTFVVCLLGNMGQWPSDWKIDVNSRKIPGSECMDGYVNDDGLCVVAPPTTTPEPTTTTSEAETAPKTPATEAAPAIPKKPVASDDNEKEGVSVDGDVELEQGQEPLESSATTRIYSYGLYTLIFISLLF